MITLTFYPLTLDRWEDLVRLFGPKGAYGGCWCMWWRLPRAEFNRLQGDGNRDALHALVAGGEVTGLLAYAGDEAVGWCSVAPRHRYPTVERSRVLKPLDDTPAWSLVCLFVARGWRQRGVSLALVQAAVEYVKEQGGSVVEAYPTVPKGEGRLSAISSFMGTPSLFARAGFVEVARPSPSRAIMRRTLA